jgi:hypothetical protein
MIKLLGALGLSRRAFERSWLFEAGEAYPPELTFDGGLFFPNAFRPAHLWNVVRRGGVAPSHGLILLMVQDWA